MEHVLTSIAKAIALDSYHVSLQMKFLQQLAWKDISPLVQHGRKPHDQCQALTK